MSWLSAVTLLLALLLGLYLLLALLAPESLA